MAARRRRKAPTKRRKRAPVKRYYRAPRRRRRRNPNPNPNPPRRKRRYYRSRRSTYRGRRGRRNPPAVMTLMPHLGWATAGFMATRFLGNTVTPMFVGITGDQPLFRMAIKLGVAYLGAWALEMGFGRKVFVPAFVGGSLEVAQDAIKTYVAPTFPFLSAYQEPLESYYERPMLPPNGPNANGNTGMGNYPNRSRMGSYYGGARRTVG